MNTLMRRGMRLAMLSLGFAGVFVAFNAIPVGATPPVGFTNQVLARGTNTSHGSVSLGSGLDIVVSRISLARGGSSDWHSHPGGAIVVVQQGELTTYEQAGKGDDEEGQSQSDQEGGTRCVITRHTVGQSFIEGPGVVVDALNTSAGDTVLFATFPACP
jgi:hypothetical protein